MKTIKLKVNDWDGESFIISATSDSLKTEIPPMAFQPSFFTEASTESVMKRIAQSFLSSVDHQEKSEVIASDSKKLKEYESLVGQSFEYSVEDLYQLDFDGIDKIREEILAQYPIASLLSIDTIFSNQYQGLNISPVVRNSDLNIVGLFFEETNNIQSANQFISDCCDLGIPVFTDSSGEFERNLKSVSSDEDTLYYTEWTLELAKNAKKQLIHKERDERVFRTIDLSNNKWQADSKSRSNLGEYITAIQNGYKLPERFVWRTADNKSVEMTETKLKNLYKKMLDQKQEAYQESWSRKEALPKATTFKQVDNV